MPAERGVPIGSYRDLMGALAGGKKLAFFRQQVLPIEPLSDLSIQVSLFYFVSLVFFVVGFKSYSVFSAYSAVRHVFLIRRISCQELENEQYF